MKSSLFAAALGISSVALAPSGTPDPNGPNTPGDGVTRQGTVPNGAPTSPPGTNQPLNPPPGAVVVPPSNQGAVFTSEPATADYPPCSKAVTDHCVQTYERGVRRARHH